VHRFDEGIGMAVARERMMRWRVFAAFVLLLCVSSAFAREPETGEQKAGEQKTAESLIDESNANAEQNAKAALAYTFHENYVASQTVISGGDRESSMQYDLLFIKGVPYRRLVSVNHQPLSNEAAARVSKRYDAMVDRIHAMSDEQRLKMAMGRDAVMIDPKQLTRMYTCNLVGHAKVHKRPATVVECKPRSDVPVGEGDAASPVSTDIKLWIDDQQPFFVRTNAVLNRSLDTGQRLTKLVIQWKLIDGVWHQTSTEVSWVGLEGSGIHGKVVDTFFHFKRFRVEAKIVP
jgi:hypothetical protein